MHMNTFTLWENDTFTVDTPKNPHVPYSEGLHVIVSPKREVPSAWADIALATDAFELSARVCKIMEDLELAPWFNIQANGNWGLLPGNTPFFHVHIYGRNKTAASWGKPVVLPEAPGTYNNASMPETDRDNLAKALAEQLS